jgi:hypothetical protein
MVPTHKAFLDFYSDPAKRTGAFEGLESDPTWSYPAELSGPSAGQSSLIHALDMFLGVDTFSHPPPAPRRAPAFCRTLVYPHSPLDNRTRC